MIPEAFIIAWARRAPWPTQTQIEQDLILSRLMIEIANHELLGSEFAMRGGTCLQKLHLTTPARYSEDLDYVRRTRSGVGPYMAALRDVATSFGLREREYEQTWEMVHMIFDGDSTSRVGRIRVKIEINVRDVESLGEVIRRPYTVDSPWWSGAADIPTSSVDELMATKLRALYQRRKGRDLFDLWMVLTTVNADDRLIVDSLHRYMGDGAFGFADFAPNIRDKLLNDEFREDLAQLLAGPPAAYDLEAAADLIMERLGSRLAGAPPLDSIRDGAWRS